MLYTCIESNDLKVKMRIKQATKQKLSDREKNQGNSLTLLRSVTAVYLEMAQVSNLLPLKNTPASHSKTKQVFDQ